jgi:hypothetical protein
MILWPVACLLTIVGQEYGDLPLWIARESAWGATHIVLGTYDRSTPGELVVIRSMKGDLKQGDRIRLDALRAISRLDRLIVKGQMSTGPGSITCSRLILLVRKKGQITPWFVSRLMPANALDENSTDDWCLTGGKLAMSVAILEAGKVYTLEAADKGNVLNNAWISEEELLRAVSVTVKRQAHLLNALRLEDAQARAQGVVAQLRFDSVSIHEREMAIQVLRSCGRAAVPALTSLLMSNGRRAVLAIDLLEDCGNQGCQVVCERLKKDTSLWKAEASSFKSGWTDEMPRANRGRIWRLRTDKSAIISLGVMHIRSNIDTSHRKAAVLTIKQLAKVWSANPVVSAEAPALLEECNKSLRVLESF